MSNEAWMRFARAMSKAYEQLAIELETEGQDSSGANGRITVSKANELADLALRQRRIFDLPEFGTERGLRPSVIARELGQVQQNVYSPLKALQKRGLAERVPGSTAWRRVAPPPA